MASAAVRAATISSHIARTRAVGDQIKSTADAGTIQKTKSNVTAGIAIVSGFIPYNPFLWVIQIPMFIVFVLLLAFAAGLSWKYSFLGAYVLQASITAYVYYAGLGIASSIFLGI